MSLAEAKFDFYPEIGTWHQLFNTLRAESIKTHEFFSNEAKFDKYILYDCSILTNM